MSSTALIQLALDVEAFRRSLDGVRRAFDDVAAPAVARMADDASRRVGTLGDVLRIDFALDVAERFFGAVSDGIASVIGTARDQREATVGAAPWLRFFARARSRR